MMPIILDIDSGLALITLNNSENGNTLTAESLALLALALKDALENSAVRVILLRSNGSIFCTGMSLTAATATGTTSSEIEKTISVYTSILTAIYSAPKPIVCCITGDVKAGGIGLISACDIVIASSRATFQLSEIYWGLVPANVMPFLLSRRLTPQTVRHLVLTGKKLSAQEALQIQLVNEVFPDATLERSLKSVIKGLFRASPKAIERAKQLTEKLAGETMASSIEYAKNSLVEMMRDPEVAAALSDFNSGLTPSWFSSFSPINSLLCKGTL